MSEKTSDYNNILNELVRAVKTLQLYPGGHPNLDAGLSKFHSLLNSSSAKYGDIKLLVNQRGFFMGDETLASRIPGVDQLARDCFLRRITQIVFTQSVTIKDIKGLLSLLNYDHTELITRGGAEKFLAKREVTGILLNEMHYEKLKLLISDLVEEDEDEAIGDDEEEAELGDGLSEEELGVKERSDGEFIDEDDYIPDDMEALAALIESLEKETDILKYSDISIRIIEKGMILLEEKNFEAIFSILKIFYNHQSDESSLPDEIKRVAHQRLETLLSLDMLSFLTVELERIEGSDYDEIEAIVMSGGTSAQSVLLNHLIDTTNAKGRRKIFNTIIKFGDDVRPEIEKRLSDDRWFAVRQMVSLLGDLGGEESLILLLNTYSHSDIRVKKEVLKALARMPSDKSLHLMLGALKDKDPSIQGQAIISLGVLKKPEAVKPLCVIATRWEPLQENTELKKEAIKALGIIGDTRAVPDLKKVLLAKVWFGKSAYEEIRGITVTSLGKIGSEEAIEALSKGEKKLEGSAFEACKRILEAHKR